MTTHMNLPRPPAWTEQALCAQVDPTLWFPDIGGGSREAIAICRRCPVIKQCLNFALEHHDTFGIYGGTTAHGRRGMRGNAA